MNRDEAKFILSAYRPGGADATDPEFAEALELARQDPELAAWFEAETRRDRAVADAFRRAVVPPALLQAQILAGRKVARPEPLHRFRTWRALAAAASILLLASIVWFRPWQARGFDGFQNGMVELLEEGNYQIELSTPHLAEIRSWLASHRGHDGIKLPADLESLPTFGCEVLSWKGRPVSLICFSAGGSVLHLFVIDRANLPGAPPEGVPQRRRSGDRQLVSWSQGGRTFLLAGTDEAALDRVFGRKG